MKLILKIKQWVDFKRKNIKVWPGAYVYITAKIGKNVSVGRNAEIGNNVAIGEGTRIGHGTFIPEGVTIEGMAFIGPGVIFSNDMYPPSPTKGWQQTFVGWEAAIGAGCVIRPGVRIGRNSLIGCGSVVTKDVPVNEIWAGNPAKKLRDKQ